jgi:glycerol-3-phosphate acyltransferase PlsY
MLAPVETAGLIVVVIVVGYLLGSIPVARLITGRDLRIEGDRNPGYWNARSAVGERRAALVLLGDAAKGATAAGLGLLLAGGWQSDQWWLGYIGAGAAMIGHAWPLFDGFRGGRSVGSFVGAVIMLAPIVALAVLMTMGVLWLLTRSFTTAARISIFMFPVAQLILEGPYRTAATGCLMCIIGLRFVMAWRQDAAEDHGAA